VFAPPPFTQTHVDTLLSTGGASSLVVLLVIPPPPTFSNAPSRPPIRRLLDLLLSLVTFRPLSPSTHQRTRSSSSSHGATTRHHYTTINFDRSRCPCWHTLRIRSWFGWWSQPRGHQGCPAASQAQEKGQAKSDGLKEYTAEEVAKHNTKEDCWVIVSRASFTSSFIIMEPLHCHISIFISQVEGKVLDVTNFLPDHPGGEKAILLYAGRDATEEFLMLHDLKSFPDTHRRPQSVC
jgi:cytochrome b involved in lipid metabolism